MRIQIHNLLGPIITMFVMTCIMLPGLSHAGDLESHIDTWEHLEEQRAELINELDDLEEEHQKFVQTIEILKDDHAAGSASRRELEQKLRANLDIVEALEQLQRQVRSVDHEQDVVRGEILKSLERASDDLEKRVREASTTERINLVSELNELQQRRRRFSSPLPETDRRRVENALAMASTISNDHPRAMLSAADELEDTQDQLLARLEAIDGRITEVERMRSLHRQSRQFGEVDSFFDEGDRGRRIAHFEQDASDNHSPGSGHSSGSSDESNEAVDDSYNSMQEAPEHDEYESGGDEPGGGPPDTNNGDALEPIDDSSMDSTPDTEIIVIETDVDSSPDETSYFNDRDMERDLRRLRGERDELREQAEELRQEASELRRKAEESY